MFVGSLFSLVTTKMVKFKEETDDTKAKTLTTTISFMLTLVESLSQLRFEGLDRLLRNTH
jgi:hypothetical protein